MSYGPKRFAWILCVAFSLAMTACGNESSTTKGGASSDATRTKHEAGTRPKEARADAPAVISSLPDVLSADDGCFYIRPDLAEEIYDDDLVIKPRISGICELNGDDSDIEFSYTAPLTDPSQIDQFYEAHSVNPPSLCEERRSLPDLGERAVECLVKSSLSFNAEGEMDTDTETYSVTITWVRGGKQVVYFSTSFTDDPQAKSKVRVRVRGRVRGREARPGAPIDGTRRAGWRRRSPSRAPSDPRRPRGPSPAGG